MYVCVSIREKKKEQNRVRFASSREVVLVQLEQVVL
jgi:hypothetical protein